MYVPQNNATLPKDVKPEDVTVEQAIQWIADKAGTKGKKKATKKKATKKKATKKE